MTNPNEWKTLGQSYGQKTDRTWDPKTEKTVQGIYVETRDVKKKDGNMTKIHVLKEYNGKLVGVWSSAVIDSRLKEAAIGNEIMITFVEKIFNQNTGKNLNIFDVKAREVPVEIEDEINDVAETKTKADDKAGENEIPF